MPRKARVDAPGAVQYIIIPNSLGNAGREIRDVREILTNGSLIGKKEKGQVLYALKKERNKNYEIKRIERFRYRTRYFTDSGIIGTKEFVSNNYRKFKNLFMSKREKIPKPIVGLDGVYSLKRLVE